MTDCAIKIENVCGSNDTIIFETIFQKMLIDVSVLPN